MKLSKLFIIPVTALTLASAGFLVNDFNAPTVASAKSKAIKLHKGLPSQFTQSAGLISDPYTYQNYTAKKFIAKSSDNTYSVGILLYDSDGNLQSANQVGAYKFTLSKKQGSYYYISDSKLKNIIAVKFADDGVYEQDVKIGGHKADQTELKFTSYSTATDLTNATGVDFSNSQN